MAPPIFTPDGTEVEEVILPDGSEASEVIAPDGTVVFEDPIPDSGLLHDYDADQLGLTGGDTVNTFTDQEGDQGASASGSPTFRESAINDEAAVEYDGSNDGHIASGVDVGQPLVIITVYEANNTTASMRLMSGDGERFGKWATDSDDRYRIDAGTRNAGSSAATGPNIFSAIFDGEDSAIRINGSTDTTGDSGTNKIDGLDMGFLSDPEQEHFDGYIARMLIYDENQMEDGQLEEIEEFFGEKYNINIS